MEITLPNKWSPRPYQQALWDYLERGGTRAVIVWHRRAGKDDVMLHHCACAAHERVGNIWYMLPEYGQCRKAIWEAVSPHTHNLRLDDAFPPELRESTNKQEMLIKLKNGSTFQLVGSDNYDSLVGSTPMGVVFSEYALTNPAAWAYIRPILLENGGWAIFNGTPRGKNHLHSLLKNAMGDPNWFAQVLTVDDTGLFSKEQLISELRELQAEHGKDVGEAMYEQEYYCSFTSALLGAYYGKEILDAEKSGRICRVEYDPTVLVYTAWDLGYSDDTTIWFYQMVGNEIHVIDYHSSNGEDVPYYAGIILGLKQHPVTEDPLPFHGDRATGKPYRYGLHWLPHDARAKTLAAQGKSIVEQLAGYLGLGKLRIVPSLSLQDGIQASRMVLKKCWFDEETTERGVKCLREYQREYDNVSKTFKDKPKHDYTSHGADAFRMLAIAYKKERPITEVTERRTELAVGTKSTFTYNDFMKTMKKRQTRVRV